MAANQRFKSRLSFTQMYLSMTKVNGTVSECQSGTNSASVEERRLLQAQTSWTIVKALLKGYLTGTRSEDLHPSSILSLTNIITNRFLSWLERGDNRKNVFAYFILIISCFLARWATFAKYKYRKEGPPEDNLKNICNYYGYDSDSNSDYYLPSDFLLIRFHNNSKSATRENKKLLYKK